MVTRMTAYVPGTKGYNTNALKVSYIMHTLALGYIQVASTYICTRKIISSSKCNVAKYHGV